MESAEIFPVIVDDQEPRVSKLPSNSALTAVRAFLKLETDIVFLFDGDLVEVHDECNFTLSEVLDRSSKKPALHCKKTLQSSKHASGMVGKCLFLFLWV